MLIIIIIKKTVKIFKKTRKINSERIILDFKSRESPSF